MYVGEGSQRRQSRCLAPGGFLGNRLASSHLTPFPYTISAPLAVALVFVPRVGVFAYVLQPCGPFKQILLIDQQFLLLPQTQKLWGFIFPELELWPHGLAWGWDHSLHRYPSKLLSTTCECGATCSATCHHSTCCLPYLPISSLPSHLDEYGFFKSLIVGLLYSSVFWQFRCFVFWGYLWPFLWLCKEARHVYLHLRLDQKSLDFSFFLMCHWNIKIQLSF